MRHFLALARAIGRLALGMKMATAAGLLIALAGFSGAAQTSPDAARHRAVALTSIAR